MTNRQWIGGMALIDFINLIVKGSDQCFLAMLDAPKESWRCNQYTGNYENIDDVCYACISHWLNEPYVNGKN